MLPAYVIHAKCLPKRADHIQRESGLSARGCAAKAARPHGRMGSILCIAGARRSRRVCEAQEITPKGPALIGGRFRFNRSRGDRSPRWLSR